MVERRIAAGGPLRLSKPASCRVTRRWSRPGRDDGFAPDTARTKTRTTHCPRHRSKPSHNPKQSLTRRRLLGGDRGHSQARNMRVQTPRAAPTLRTRPRQRSSRRRSGATRVPSPLTTRWPEYTPTGPRQRTSWSGLTRLRTIAGGQSGIP